MSSDGRHEISRITLSADVIGTQLAENDDWCGQQSHVAGWLDVGCYVLVVEGFGSNEGAYTVAAACLLQGLPH